jgi:PKD repeat protein
LWPGAEDDVSGELEMRLAETEAELQTAEWQPFVGEVEWSSSKVWAQYRDESGNVSPVYSDTITIDIHTPIEASFVVSQTACANSPIPVINTTNPYCEDCGWNWDFGNGATSIVKAPSDEATYPTGVYTITLNVAGLTNVSSTSQQVTVLPSPSSIFTITQTGPTIDVEAGEKDATAWEWDFGDGHTAAGRTASHTYQSAAFEQELPVIRLNVTGDNGCTSESFAQVEPATQSVYLPLIVR